MTAEDRAVLDAVRPPSILIVWLVGALYDDADPWEVGALHGLARREVEREYTVDEMCDVLAAGL